MQSDRESARAPTTAAPNSERLEVRIPADLKDLLTLAASLRGQTLTTFVISTVTDAARRVVREHEVLEWSRRDQQAFAAALAKPPAPAIKLTEAAAWSREQAKPHG